MLTREMSFMPAVTLTTWLRELYSIQPITVATASNKELSFFKIDTFYVTFLKLAGRKIGLQTVLDKMYGTIVKVIGYVPVVFSVRAANLRVSV